MNLNVAKRMARELYGLTAMCVRVKSDFRKERCRIGYIGTDGLLVFAGIGGTFEEAFADATSNPQAVEHSEKVAKMRREIENAK